jgi:hypothetical protein
MPGAAAGGNSELRLSDADITMFDYSRIAHPMLVAAGVCRVTDSEARGVYDIYWWDGSVDLSGILYPYHHVLTGKRVSCRLRLDNPPVDSQGRLVKYLTPPHHRAWRHLYSLPGAERYLKDTQVPALIVESEKSALAGQSAAECAGRSLLVIATGGVSGWTGRIGKEPQPDGSTKDQHGPLPDWYHVAWQERQTVIMFDSDTRSNVNVRTARRRLAAFLIGEGAVVRVAELGNVFSQPDSGKVE